MKKNLLTKIRNRKGFTLAELLIVVAIIGVLVAVSIPIFTAQLRKAKVATDQANARAAKAAFVAYYLDDSNSTSTALYYDADKGIAVPTTTTVAAYGKTSDAKGTDNIDGVTGDTAQDLTTKKVKGVYNTTDNSVTLSWE